MPAWSRSGRLGRSSWPVKDSKPCWRRRRGFPYRGAPLTPAWAALSGKKLAALPVIPGVQRLILLIDNDSNQEGQTAAARVAAGWRAQGRAVVPLMPDTADTDFNDLVLKEDSRVAA